METSRSLPESGLQGRGLRKVASFFGFAPKKNASRSKTPTKRPERLQSHPTAYAGDVPAASEALQRHSAPASRVEAAEREGETGTSYDLPTNLKDHFDLGRSLGHGGNAVVVRAVSRHTGKEFACKCISKVLTDATASPLKKADHKFAIQRELDAVRKLRGALNVAAFEDAYEDSENVYIITELCRGGELWHRIGDKHYSERTVASYMRAVLRTLAQFHSHRLLHRDVKPGNFMLLNEDERSPLKAIDFGLAVSFDPEQLPRSDLGLEGTPWFMAPEVLSSAVVPASDIWSAGVMAHQLLTGRFPFDDKTNPGKPAISKIWQSILLDKLNFKRSCWDGISDEAKDFVAQLLNKDPVKRPSAKEALKHPWLRGSVSDRSTGKPLSLKVVQRIQRYGQSSQFKRTVLEFIVEEMLGARSAEAGNATSCPITIGATPLLTSPSDSPLEFLYQQLNFSDSDVIDRQQLSLGLQRLGYKLETGEVDRLLDQLDLGHTGRVAKGQFAASQIDWGVLQKDHSRWLECVRHAFDEFDTDGDGVCSVDEIVRCLKAKLPLTEVAPALRHAMKEAHKHEESMKNGLNFEQFMVMLRADSRESLDQYDDRIGGSNHGSSAGGSAHGGSYRAGTYGLAALLDRSVRAGEVFQPKSLDPVAEAA